MYRVAVWLIFCLKVVVTFSDVRVLAVGVLHTPLSSWTVNHNAQAFLNPPGIVPTDGLGVNLGDNNRVVHNIPCGEWHDRTSGNDQLSRSVARFVVTLFLSGLVFTFRIQEAYTSSTCGVSLQLSVIYSCWGR